MSPAANRAVKESRTQRINSSSSSRYRGDNEAVSVVVASLSFVDLLKYKNKIYTSINHAEIDINTATDK